PGAPRILGRRGAVVRRRRCGVAAGGARPRLCRRRLGLAAERARRQGGDDGGPGDQKRTVAARRIGAETWPGSIVPFGAGRSVRSTAVSTTPPATTTPTPVQNHHLATIGRSDSRGTEISFRSPTATTAEVSASRYPGCWSAIVWGPAGTITSTGTLPLARPSTVTRVPAIGDATRRTPVVARENSFASTVSVPPPGSSTSLWNGW